jgi:hypothetical protein
MLKGAASCESSVLDSDIIEDSVILGNYAE